MRPGGRPGRRQAQCVQGNRDDGEDRGEEYVGVPPGQVIQERGGQGGEDGAGEPGGQGQGGQGADPVRPVPAGELGDAQRDQCPPQPGRRHGLARPLATAFTGRCNRWWTAWSPVSDSTVIGSNPAASASWSRSPLRAATWSKIFTT